MRWLAVSIIGLCLSLSLSGCITATSEVLSESKPNSETSDNLEKKPWAVAQGRIDGKPVFERFRADLKKPDADYPYQATFVVPFKNPTADGLFSKEEEAALDKFEEYLCEQIETTGDGIFVSVHTLNGQRTFVFYTKKDLREKAEDIVKHAPEGYKIGGEIVRDPEWSLFMGTLKRYKQD